MSASTDQSDSQGGEAYKRRLVLVGAVLLYNVALTLLLPLILFYFLWRALSDRGYASGYRQRLGWVNGMHTRPIWLHCASVGEVNASAPLLQKLQKRFFFTALLFSCLTPTGKDRLQAVCPNHTVNYLPIDWPPFLLLFFLRVRPCALILVERDLWPNLLLFCRLFDIPVAVVNARMNEGSLQSYLRIDRLLSPLLRRVYVVAQEEEDAARFKQLGVCPERMVVAGNLKFDISISEPEKQLVLDYRNSTHADGHRFTWLAASTHRGEDEVVLDVHRRLLEKHPRALLVLAPRHPERFQSVAEQAEVAGLSVVRASNGGFDKLQAETQVLLIDRMGELFTSFGVAEIAFIGGSLVPVGGHNALEAAVWACPVLSGPHVYNARATADGLHAAGALQWVMDGDELFQALDDAAANTDELQQRGESARRYLESKAGATDDTVEVVKSMWEQAQ